MTTLTPQKKHATSCVVIIACYDFWLRRRRRTGIIIMPNY